MKITELSVILEIAGHPQGKDLPRYMSALNRLKESSIGKHRIIGVAHISRNEPPCRVPGFGHNYQCDDKCICKVQPYSVLRYFGIVFWVIGDPPLSLLKTYKLTEYARIDICGKDGPYKPGQSSLKTA